MPCCPARAEAAARYLAYRGHLLTENHNGLVVSTLTTRAYASAERDAALLMAEGLPGTHRVALGADKSYDAHDFIAELRHMEITPHIAQNNTNRRSAVDERTTRHAGYSSQSEETQLEMLVPFFACTLMKSLNAFQAVSNAARRP